MRRFILIAGAMLALLALTLLLRGADLLNDSVAVPLAFVFAIGFAGASFAAAIKEWRS